MLLVSIGILARCYGEEEKDAAAVARHGMVDETETTAVETEAESASV